MASLPPAPVQVTDDAADLADASADSPVLRALAAASIKPSVDKAAAPESRTEAAPKPVNAASASKPDPRPLGETLHVAAKELAVNTGAVDAKQYLDNELGLDKSSDASADADARNVMRRRANATPPRLAEQLKLDEEQASFLASALVQEVMPWAIGAAVLLGCLQGLRAMLFFSRRKTERKRRYRKSSSASRNARL